MFADLGADAVGELVVVIIAVVIGIGQYIYKRYAAKAEERRRNEGILGSEAPVVRSRPAPAVFAASASPAFRLAEIEPEPESRTGSMPVVQEAPPPERSGAADVLLRHRRSAMEIYEILAPPKALR